MTDTDHLQRPVDNVSYQIALMELRRVYVTRADERQKAMGLSYVDAEITDLAEFCMWLMKDAMSSGIDIGVEHAARVAGIRMLDATPGKVMQAYNDAVTLRARIAAWQDGIDECDRQLASDREELDENPPMAVRQMIVTSMATAKLIREKLLAKIAETSVAAGLEAAKATAPAADAT